MARVRSLADGFKDGTVTLEQISEVAEKMAQEKSLVAGGIILFIEKMLLDESDLEPEQREAAALALQRVARGVIEDKIELQSLEDLVNEFMEPGPDPNKKTVKKDLTKEEVDQIIAKANELADEAEVPNLSLIHI